MDGVAKLRHQILDAGYAYVPVRTNQKVPEGFAWQKRALDRVFDNVAHTSMNTGIATAGLRAIDIDIDDAEIASKVRALAIEMLGNAPERSRANSCRTLLVYRASDGEPSKQSIVSAKSENGKQVPIVANLDGKPAKVEILGKGQQFVAYGMHPSGAEFEWRNRELFDCNINSLVAITQGDVDRFLEESALLLGIEHEPRCADQIKSHSPLHMTTNGGQDVDLNELAELIDYIHPDCPYDEWVNVLMAIHAETNGGADGLSIADKWSSHGSKYRGSKEIEIKWRSFKSGGINRGTIANMARANGADLSAIAAKYYYPEITPEKEAEYSRIAKVIYDNWQAKRMVQIKADHQLRIDEAVADEWDDDSEVIGGASGQFDIPDNLLNPPGLVGEIADWICQWAQEPIRLHAIGAALSVVGTLAGRKIYTETMPTCTSLYIGITAPSGMGKQHPQNAIRLLMDGFNAGGMITGWNVSLPSLATRLMNNASLIMIADEFADKLVSIRGAHVSASSSAISEGLRSIWGTNTGVFNPDVSMSRGEMGISRPNLSIFGASTHKDFTRSLVSKDVTNGLFNRFLILPRYGEVKEQSPPKGIMSVPDRIKNRLDAVNQCIGPHLGVTMATRGDGFPDSPLLVPFTVEASRMNDENKAHQRTMMRKSDQSDALAIYGRYAEQIKRMALIVACGRGPDVGFGNLAITGDDMIFAKNIVDYSTMQFVATIRAEMVENQIEANRKLVLNTVKKSGKIKRSQLLRKIRTVRAFEMNEILGVLLESNSIVEVDMNSPTFKAKGYQYLRG